MNSKIKIEKGIPTPEHGNGTVMPDEMKNMRVGESCVVSQKATNAYRQHCYRFQKKLVTRKQPKKNSDEATMFRVWRVK